MIHEVALQYMVQITILLVIAVNVKVVVVHGDSKCWLVFKQLNIFPWYICQLFPSKVVLTCDMDDRSLQALGLHGRYCRCCLFLFLFLDSFCLPVMGKPLILSSAIYVMAGNKSWYHLKHVSTFFGRFLRNKIYLIAKKICSTKKLWNQYENHSRESSF